MSATAKIFMHGRSQAVRLPKAFRLPGKEVRVSRVGSKVILEPIEEAAPFDAAAFWARIDGLRGDAPDLQIPPDEPPPPDTRSFVEE